MSSIERLREWFLADTLPVWLEKGYDRANRSFHERLNLDFSPVTEGGKRVLVQARQIYTYSSSANSIAGALDAAQSAFEFTEAKYRHPAGGWRHRVTHEGAPLDDSRDLYDQAFVVFACAVLYRATGREDVLAAALETLQYLEAERSHPAGGFTEIVPGDGSAFEGPRRQNPHMHLFEAMLESEGFELQGIFFSDIGNIHDMLLLSWACAQPLYQAVVGACVVLEKPNTILRNGSCNPDLATGFLLRSGCRSRRAINVLCSTNAFSAKVFSKRAWFLLSRLHGAGSGTCCASRVPGFASAHELLHL